ncbi:Lipoxygenase [Corchorus olitorius]|uniref:Lipoxygenase n=1 Tax=Corchorus olitorius TaxID=93759 RepID=A0A1R3G9A7_9ROSI|nr:Lipoxygenase [Corchorus olitorius]
MRWWAMMREKMWKNMEKGVTVEDEEEEEEDDDDDDDDDSDSDSDGDYDDASDNNDNGKDQKLIGAIHKIEKYLAVKRWKRKTQQILRGVLEGVQKEEGDDRDDDDSGGDEKYLVALYEIEKYLAMQGKFVFKNYPYARDGMEIWKAIETWVSAYCNIFYKNNEAVENDAEIQAWWSEIRKEGHGDQKEGWYPLSNLGNLTMALTTLIWITSGLHAALNFGQYAYAGWPPNRPMLLRKPIPDHKQQREDNQSPNQQERDDASTWLKHQVLPEKFDMAFVIAVMDVLSRHTSDEVYLGQRPPSNEWKEYDQVNKKFEEFKKELVEIEKNIKERNKSFGLMNMTLETAKTAKIPYKILYPDTSKAKSYPNVASDAMLRITGVVELGMFLDMATTVIVTGELGITIKHK